MEQLKEYIIQNAIVSSYYQDTHDTENITFYEATISITFNNKQYYDSICDLSYNKKYYEHRLYNKLIDNIIYDLGKTKLSELFNN